MNTHFEQNEVTKRLPEHLHKFIVKQPYDDYTSQNQAVWRYVMRANIDYLKKVAHHSYTPRTQKNRNFHQFNSKNGRDEQNPQRHWMGGCIG